MNIKLISFDLDNTLWPADKLIIHAQNTMIDWVVENFPSLQPIDIPDTLWSIRQELVQQQPDILHNLTQLRKMVMQRFFIAQEFSKQEAARGSEQAFQVFIEQRNQVTPYPGTLETLKKLKQKFKLASITNGNSDLSKTPLKQIFDFSISSETAGVSKPDPKIFQALLDHFKLQAAQVIHIGDHPIEDILGAQQLGIRSVWFHSPGTPWPNDQDHRPDHSISKITDLESLL